METGLFVVAVLVVFCIVRLNIWHYHFDKQEKKRWLQLTPEQRAAAEEEDWWDRQW